MEVPIDRINASDGDVVLECEDGVRLRAHSQVLGAASSMLKGVAGLARDSADKIIPVKKGSSGTWTSILLRIYPLHPRPELTVDAIYEMLPVAHHYALDCVLSELVESLTTAGRTLFPRDFTTDPDSPCYLIRWLALADELQLDPLLALCLRKVRDLSNTKQLDALFVDNHTGCLPPGCTEPRPAACPAGNHGASCEHIVWCRSHAKWACKGSGSYSSASCGCSTSSSNFEKPHSWKQGDRPLPKGDIRKLRAETLAELLASVVVSAGRHYSGL